MVVASFEKEQLSYVFFRDVLEEIECKHMVLVGTVFQGVHRIATSAIEHLMLSKGFCCYLCDP